MRKVLLSLVGGGLLWSLVSCGPVKTYINIESKGASEYPVTLDGKSISVVSVVKRSDRDSALVSELGLGVAEKIEVEMGLPQGAVGVYSVPEEDSNVLSSSTLDMVAIESDSDIIIALDSLQVGSYRVIRDGSKAYHEGEFKDVVDVALPVAYKVQAYDAVHLKTLVDKEVVDTITWSIMGDGQIQNSTAISQANTHLKEAFRTIGEATAHIFLPEWKQQERMIVCFSGSKWENAYYLASDFKWEQAMDVWLELVKGGSPDKQGAAAYNLAVACEILGRYDTALKWLDFAESKCYFSQMSTLRKKLQER